MDHTGVVVNAAIVAGKAPRRPAAGIGNGTAAKIPTYLGSVSVLRGPCTVIANPRSITVNDRTLSWSDNASVSCGQPGHFTVDIVASRQV